MNPIIWNTIRLIASLNGWQPSKLVSILLGDSELNRLQKMYLRCHLYRCSTNSITEDERKAAYILCIAMWRYVTCMRPLSEEYNRFQ